MTNDHSLRPYNPDRAAREARLDALHERLTDAVSGLVTGEDWRRALEFAARFRSRSFNNTLLIYAQHAEAYQQGRVREPMPTYVAGFRQWLSLGRSVVKGQSGYQILAPVTARFTSSDPAVDGSWRRLAHNERPRPGETVRSRMVGLRLAYVFDVTQTEGDPIPETPRPTLLPGVAPEGLWDGLADQIATRGFGLRLVANARALGGANGLTDHRTQEVSVRLDMDDAARVKTLAHELGHVMLHATGRPVSTADAALHRGIAEVEAESVALMVAGAHGLDTSCYTVPYVATWADRVPGSNPVSVVQATAERVRGAALTILDNLDTAQIGAGDPPRLERRHLRRTPGLEPERPVQWSRPETVGL